MTSLAQLARRKQIFDAIMRGKKLHFLVRNIMSNIFALFGWVCLLCQYGKLL